MIRALLSLFAWRFVRIAGVWAYWQNDVTGEREAVWLGGAFGPVAHDWLAGGEWRDGAPGNPPNAGSAASKPLGLCGDRCAVEAAVRALEKP